MIAQESKFVKRKFSISDSFLDEKRVPPSRNSFALLLVIFLLEKILVEFFHHVLRHLALNREECGV